MLELSRGFRKVLVENFQLGLFLLLSTSLLACMGFFSLYRLVIHDWLMAAFDSAITLLILALQVYAWRSRRMDVVGWFSMVLNTGVAVWLVLRPAAPAAAPAVATCGWRRRPARGSTRPGRTRRWRPGPKRC